MSARRRQPVFGAGGEHAVGLGHAAGHQVVDQHADIGLRRGRAATASRPPARARGVEPGDQPLGGRLLIAGRAVDLAGEDTGPGSALGLQRRVELARVDVVVFDRVAGPHHPRVLEARDGAPATPPGRPRGRRGRDAVRIDRVVVQPLGLEEDLVALARRRSARPCPRSTGSSAGPRPAISPAYIGERCEVGADDRVGRRRWCR